MFRQLLQSVLQADIRVLIFLFFAIRMAGITNPPLETSHNWRQADMMMVARNMSQGQGSLLYPQVDYTGSQPGVIGMEFPLVNWLTAQAIKAFGFQHWYARLINLLFTSVGIYFFYLLISEISGRRAGYYSALVLMGTLWFAIGRKIMPDTFSASFIIAGLYAGICYLRSGKRYLLIPAAVLLAIGGLTKISSFVLLAIILPATLDKELMLGRKAALAAAYASAVVLSLYWYVVWVPYLNSLSPARFFMGKPLALAVAEIVADPSGIGRRFYETALGISGFAAFVAGIYFAAKKRETALMIIFSAGFAIEALFLLKTGAQFAMHSYYITAFVPIMAAGAGYALSHIPTRYAAVFAAVICIEGGARAYSEFIIKTKHAHIADAGALLDRCGVPRSAYIATNTTVSPTLLYFTGRKGWTPGEDQLQNLAYVQHLKAMSCSYVLVEKVTFGTDIRPAGCTEIFRDEHYTLFAIQ